MKLLIVNSYHEIANRRGEDHLPADFVFWFTSCIIRRLGTTVRDESYDSALSFGLDDRQFLRGLSQMSTNFMANSPPSQQLSQTSYP